MRILWIVTIATGLFVQLSEYGTAQVADATADDLIQQLGDKAVEKRRDAAYELVRRMDHSDAVIAALGKATADDDTQVRIQSLTGLARASKKSEPVIPELLKCLRNRDDQVRYRAAQALGAIGVAAIEPLTTYWPTASNESKIAVAQGFAIIGPEARVAIPLLTEGLDESSKLPRYAAEAIVAIVPQDETTLLKIAQHPDAAARKVGIIGLSGLTYPSEAALRKLQEAASDSEPKIREIAIVVVAKSRMPDSEKAAVIESAIADTSAPVRAAAIMALRKASLPAADLARRLMTRLPTVDVDGANALVKAISMLGPDAKVSLPSVLEVASKEGIDQQLVSQALASFGAGVVPDLLSAIEKQPAIEPILSRALGMIGEPAVESLTRGMSSEVELVRVAATRALGGVRPLNKGLLQKLAIAIEDKSAKVREVAVKSLVIASKDAEFIKASILKSTHDTEPCVRAVALQSLRIFKFTDAEIKEAFERCLKDPSPEVRSSALTVLSEIPKTLSANLDQLVVLVADTDSRTRAKAAQTLGKLDKKQLPESVVKACVVALSDGDFAVRIAATESVKSLSISDSAVLNALAGNLVDDLALLRVTLETLSGFGEKAASMIPAVSLLATHEKAEVRVAAINALAAIEKDSQQLTGRLINALDDKEWEVRRVVGVALGKLGPEAKNAVPKLFRLLSSDEDRDFASSALKEINTAPVEAIPLLMEKLDSEERRTAFYAVSLLGKIGPPAAEAIPKLEAMLAKPSSDSGRSEFRKKFLVEAIAAIKGESKSKESK